MRSALLLAALLLAGCDPPHPFQARFTVRGRWSGPRTVPYALEADDGPLAPAPFVRAVERALQDWAATGCVEFRPIAPGEAAAVVIGWRRAAHDACPAFGADPSVSHAGPVGPGTFVHLDAARTWDEGAVGRAVLHELGHVLGLDHTADEEAAMHPVPSPARARLARSDLAGIHSLYGGGADAPGDLVVHRADGSEALVLRAVAPHAITGWTTLDVDGDGAEEVLVWRTDVSGAGALCIYRFDPGPVLARTRGPELGVVPAGASLAPARGPRGEFLLVLTPPRGSRRALAFDAAGRLVPFEGEPPEPAVATPADARRADLDGDGTMEELRRR